MQPTPPPPPVSLNQFERAIVDSWPIVARSAFEDAVSMQMYVHGRSFEDAEQLAFAQTLRDFPQNARNP